MWPWDSAGLTALYSFEETDKSVTTFRNRFDHGIFLLRAYVGIAVRSRS